MKQEGREEQEDEIVFDRDSETSNHKKQILIFQLSQRLIHGDLLSRIEAAKDLRKLARKSSPKSRSNLGASSLIQPLVCMLLSPNLDAREASLLALLNLASRNERFVHLLPFLLALVFDLHARSCSNLLMISSCLVINLCFFSLGFILLFQNPFTRLFVHDLL